MARTRFNLAQVTLVGRVGSVALRGAENKILSLSLATDHPTGGRDNRQYTTDWHDVSVFQNAENLANRIVKGDFVTVVGELRYNVKDGVKYANIVADTVVPAPTGKGQDQATATDEDEDWN